MRCCVQPLWPAGIAGPEPAEPEELSREPPRSCRGLDAGEDARSPGVGRPRADRAAQPALTPNPREVRVAAAVVGCDTLGSEVGHDVELVFAEHLHDRDVLLAERSRLCSPPRRLVAESCLRGVLDLGGIDAVVLIRDVDGKRARPVGGLGEGDCKLAMAETDHLERVSSRRNAMQPRTINSA